MELLGITLIGILAGAVGQATFASSLMQLWAGVPLLGLYTETISLALVAAAVTVLFVILGELVPKRLALLNPEGIASSIAPAMKLLAQLASPLVRALNASTDCMLGLCKVRASLKPPITEEEINILMQKGAAAGVFEQHEQALVARMFRMDEQRITGPMTPRANIVYLDLRQGRSGSAFPVGLYHASGDAPYRPSAKQPPLEGLSPSHGAFQEHAAHTRGWSQVLNSKGSLGACTPKVFPHSAMPLARRTERTL